MPACREDLWLEHAAAREAISLAWQQHRQALGELSGVRRGRSGEGVFGPDIVAAEGFDLCRVDLILGIGGIFTGTPQLATAAKSLLYRFNRVRCKRNGSIL